jgi:hypothetical protein
MTSSSETGTRRSAIEFNPFDPAFIADPFPVLHRLRREDPVHRSELGFWILTRYDDVATTLRDRRFGAAFDPNEARARMGEQAAFAYVSRRLHNYDPPDHTRLRSLVTKAFTAKRVETMRPHIEELANELLDQVKGERRVDVVGALAHPLPSLVICEMLGVPKDDRPRFSAWTEDIAFLIGPLIEPDRLEAGERAAGEFMDYVRVLVAERRKAPSDDLLSALIGAGEDGDRLSVDELVATVVFLFSAGHQTTRDLTGNGLLALLPHSEQTDRLVAEPDLLLEAVEECLRYDPSVTLTARRALEEVSIRGRKISAGDHVILSISAANRDPAIFSDPDRFDIERRFKEHLTFGGGIHYCLGATLARLELQIIFGCLLRRYPGLRLADEPVRWRQTATFRGPLAVEVVLG